MSSRKLYDLYADGGVILKNPSKIGGTYAWVLVDGDKLFHEYSSVLTPQLAWVDAVTNNQTELHAVLDGVMWALDHDVKIGRIFTDSQVTYGRLYKSWSLKNIPPWMVDNYNYLLYYVHKTRGFLVKGHNGDKWNEYCDKLCRQEAERFMNYEQ